MSDLIIEGAKGIPDGLYVIKDGELFKYKAKGGTVRSYHITDRPRGEWIDENHRPKSWQFKCSECGETAYYPQRNHEKYQSGKLCGYNFCPNCGADMRSE